MTATTQRALLGCIADDFTGATDLANMLVRGGMRTVQTIGVPGQGEGIEADAIVVALKSRTIPAAEAVAQSLAALDWLRAQGCRQFVFKYCSTFDSTDAGNIGPVTDALLDALSGGDQASAFTIACPAFPENGRTIRSRRCVTRTSCVCCSVRRKQRSGSCVMTPSRKASMRCATRSTPCAKTVSAWLSPMRSATPTSTCSAKHAPTSR